MNRRWVVLLLGLVAGMITSMSVSVMAADKAAPAATTPHQVITGVTENLMAVIRGNADLLQKDPPQYFAKIRAVLEPTVSFEFISKNVMASYWGAASEQQRRNFTETFTRSMVETLGKGMANFTDLKIQTLAPEGDVSQQKKVEVQQEVKGADGTSRVSYTMAKSSSGDWKLINVVLNGVNLGKSFRDQFVQAMKQNENNIDKVIESWAQKG